MGAESRTERRKRRLRVLQEEARSFSSAGNSFFRLVLINKDESKA
jgi:hypothetical protein